MADTAQPVTAADPAPMDPNAAIAAAADAFKTFDSPALRDEAGRFAAKEIETVDEGEPEEGELEATDDDGEIEEQEEAAEEAQPEPVPMPSSWSKEEAERWNALPPETQAFIAEREGQRDAAINSKFQEAANVKKEAAKARDELAGQLDLIMSAINPVKPDPRAFGYGTQHYNREAYDIATAEYETQTQTLEALKSEREALAKQQAEEETRAFQEWKQQHEAQYAPKLLSDVPELTDPAKGGSTLNEIISYAIANGIPAENFDAEVQDQITSAQLHMVWKAKEYDRLKASGKPVARQASPAVKPGVTSPRSATKAAAYRKATDNLAKSGSIEAGAAIFKHAMQGIR